MYTYIQVNGFLRLKRHGVMYIIIYNVRHACTRAPTWTLLHTWSTSL